MGNAKGSQDIEFIVDDDPKLNYEKNKIPCLLASPFMYLLGIWVLFKKIIFGKKLKTNTFWVDGISPTSREIKDNAQGWRAVDILYNYKFNQRKTFEGIITDFWLDTINSQGMRNRLKLVKKCLRAEIDRISKTSTEVRIFSVACGSAQAVVEVLSEYKEKNIKIKACLLDLDLSALEHSKLLAQNAGIVDQFQYINKSARESEEFIKKFDPQIVEIVGFLEYRPKDRTIELINRIYRLLNAGGVLLTSTVTPTYESFFLKWAVDWPMIYRTRQQFIDILRQVNFRDIKIVCEPLQLQKIAICRK